MIGSLINDERARFLAADSVLYQRCSVTDKRNSAAATEGATRRLYSNGPLIPKEDKLRRLNLRVIFPNSRCLASCKVRSKRRGLKITGIEGIVYLFAE